MEYKYRIITIWIIGIIVIISGYYFMHVDSVNLPDFLSNDVIPEKLANILAAESAGDISAEEPEPQIYKDSYEYRNKRYGFSLFYPKHITVQEFNEGGGASTIVFEDIEKGQGFQIFIVPYSEKQVSEERFTADVPSGVKQDPLDFYIDGAVAASFYSKNITLGDTWEVWIINKGFLYEITTHKNLDNWLSNIIKSWRFTG